MYPAMQLLLPCAGLLIQVIATSGQLGARTAETRRYNSHPDTGYILPAYQPVAFPKNKDGQGVTDSPSPCLDRGWTFFIYSAPHLVL